MNRLDRLARWRPTDETAVFIVACFPWVMVIMLALASIAMVTR